MAAARDRTMFAILLVILALPSCRTAGDTPASLLQLRQGFRAEGPPAEARGVLTDGGGCLRVAGNGTTIVVWPRTANARAVEGNGNTVVIWPRTAVARGGGGTVIIVWPRTPGTGASVRAGDRIEIDGIYVADAATLALAAGGPADCRTGPAIIAREFRRAQ